MSEQDLTPEQLEQLRDQLASVPAGAVVADTAMQLATMAQMRLGLPPEEFARFRDLEAARLLIDAFGGLLSATEGRLGAPEPALRQALADLRLAFAEVAAHPAAGEPAPGPAPGAEAPPEDSGILRPPSGLWVPGQD
jgi:Domain of unknown function (DUF1844)